MTTFDDFELRYVPNVNPHDKYLSYEEHAPDGLMDPELLLEVIQNSNHREVR